MGVKLDSNYTFDKIQENSNIISYLTSESISILDEFFKKEISDIEWKLVDDIKNYLHIK